jgi:2-hydroxychromene-2-carboxylate isomerase
MKNIDFYFDFVSPFSYLCVHRLGELPVPVTFKPVLFAGLLNHWGQKGPAEIVPKRRWTYRWCTWWARRLGVPFRFPASHPFNPLHHLRLALACGSTEQAVKRIFESIWMSGGNANDPAVFEALCRELSVQPSVLSSDEIKTGLRRNTEAAAARGVFGVPSFVVDGEVFWGADSIDFLKDFLADPAVVRNDEMRRADTLPAAAERRGPTSTS